MTRIGLAVLLAVAAVGAAGAIKHDPDPQVQIEQLRTELKLKRYELLVATERLDACKRQCP